VALTAINSNTISGAPSPNQIKSEADGCWPRQQIAIAQLDRHLSFRFDSCSITTRQAEPLGSTPNGNKKTVSAPKFSFRFLTGCLPRAELLGSTPNGNKKTVSAPKFSFSNFVFTMKVYAVGEINPKSH
jgi:hypothetical protein